ncbi:MAG: M6 family metalloprotease domain-containing protein [Fibrobacteria bacterium]|nr:M6 family metalloprotease domain-containing protein [Fibrobacteria bacterium]
MKSFLVVILLFVFGYSAPHFGDIYKLKQPDGSLVSVKIYGDEYYQRVETPDGYTLVRDVASGWICYAELSEDGAEYLPTANKYSAESPAPDKSIKSLRISTESRNLKRREAIAAISGMPDVLAKGALGPYFPVSYREILGDVKGLCLLIDFSDDTATFNQEEIDDFLNGDGYNNFENNGSVKEYWNGVSGGKLNYTNHVSAYYRAPRTKAYYNQEAVGGNRVVNLILSALQALDNDGFDYSTLTATENRRIMALNIFYAGEPDAGWAQGLWPHAGIIDGLFRSDNMVSGLYQISPLRDTLSLKTICHENGHMLGGWPDLYDAEEPYSSGVGFYGLMATGGWNIFDPMPPQAFLRHTAGWDSVVDISTVEPGIYRHVANSNSSFLFMNPSDSNELFYIESRVKSNRGRNNSVPDEGLLIWHIDKNGDNNYEDMTLSRHYISSVEQADGKFDLELYVNGGGIRDFFHAGYNDEFSGLSLPDSRWWDGSESGLNMVNISDVGDTMSFELQKAPMSIYLTEGPGGDTLFRFTGQQIVAPDHVEGVNFVAGISGPVKSVVMSLVGKNTTSRLLNDEPYLLVSEPWIPVKGEYTLMVTAYADTGGEGGILAKRNIPFLVLADHIPLKLVDADSERVLLRLDDTTLIDLETLPDSLNILAEPLFEHIGKVVFELSGPQERVWTENYWPYLLYADNNGNYNPWTPLPLPGEYLLTVSVLDTLDTLLESKTITLILEGPPVPVPIETGTVLNQNVSILRLNSTQLVFAVKEQAALHIGLFSVDGRRTVLANKLFKPGKHSLFFPEKKSRIGVNFLVIQGKTGEMVKKILFLP